MTASIPPLLALNRIRRRTPETLLGIARLNDPVLAGWLRSAMSATTGVDGWPVLPPPVLEAAHPFKTSPETIGSLAGGLLHADLVAALAGESDPNPARYRLPRDLHPFVHQMEAWRILTDQKPRSLVVTSGTGSGKTECFLIPLLNDLVRQSAASGRLEGVQAIALYPLNALIESQRERLSDWCSPFGSRIRFGLYNGDLPEEVRSADRQASPTEVPDRVSLRQSPPPILVTNITMLEYMLVRAKDESILEKSRGKLRWIILDEAHTHIGSAAAELALLLRRVMQAFAVEPEDVRFVATSATIGSGEQTRAALKKFLADVAGLKAAQVDVVEGRPSPLDLPPVRRDHKVSRQELERLVQAVGDDNGGQLFDLLAPSPTIQRFIADLNTRKMADWARVEEMAQELALDPDLLIEAMARASRKPTENGARTLGPLRIQAFHRSVPGVWSCVNPECSGKPYPEWGYGALYPSARDCCHHCQSPVVTVAACTDCGEPYLLGREVGASLVDYCTPVLDEFADEPDRTAAAQSSGGEDEEISSEPEASSVGGMTHAIALREHAHAHRLDISIPDGEGLRAVALRAHRANECAHCGAQENKGVSPLRPLRLSGPLLLRNATPILLETTAPTAPEPGQPRKPSDGRRLLSFTDSRQGTARLAAFLQADAERTFLRSMIYHEVQQKGREGGDPEILQMLEFLRGEDKKSDRVAQEIKRLETRLAAEVPSVRFSDLESRIAQHPDLENWIMPVWEGRDPELFGNPEKLAKFFLLRELARRPRSANSAETMGLAALRFKDLTGREPPSAFKSNGGTKADWEDFLHIATWAFLRANLILSINPSMARWMLPKGRLNKLVTRSDHELAAGEMRFPVARPKGGRSRMAQLLYAGLDLNPDDRHDQGQVQDILEDARNALSPVMTSDGTGTALDLVEKASLVPLESCYACPLTRRVLDRAFRGFTPWGFNNIYSKRIAAERITMPRHPAPFACSEDQAELLAQDPLVQSLRAQGLWTSLHDRLVPNPSFARSAEHSAQQPRRLLKGYETAFARGEINVLNCSTTMEMGVDIGSVSTVLLSNVPPSLSSYRQRIGRAGRRGQAMSLALTVCKDRPLDREVFDDPRAFLRRSIAAPSVSLDSRPIVQRHVNALALSHYLRSIGADAMSGTAGAFLLSEAKAPGPSWGKKFVQFLGKQEALEQLGVGLKRLVRETCLESYDPSVLLEASATAIEAIRVALIREVDALRSQKGGDGKADRAIDRQIERLTDEYLLAFLAGKGFLPGHGFPTDVVAFLPTKRAVPDASKTEDGARSKFTSRDAPQRSLDLAIRDYAPGADIVIDGLVHKSAGVTLNWKRPASEELKEVQSLRWMLSCKSCGELVDTAIRPQTNTCPTCGSTHTKLQRWLRPAGFTSDFRTPVHAEIETPAFVPPEPVRVSAAGALWMPLAEPDTGRYRCNPEGLVFHENRGIHKQGYAVCLVCGRAEAETSGESGLANPLDGHKPLRGRGEEGSGLCPSHKAPFSIVRRLSLGSSVQTDVFELELPGLKPAAAWALASALRTSLAGFLGVEPSELGIAIAPRTDAIGRAAHAVILWDKACGGAGFATRAPDHLEALLARCEGILDCTVDGCITGCSNCVIDPDTSDPERTPDRREALAYLRLLLTRNRAPLGVLGQQPGAKLVRNLHDDLLSVVADGGSYRSVTVFATHLGQSGAAGARELAASLHTLRKRGLTCTIALPSALVKESCSADRLALRDLAISTDARLAQLISPVVLPGGLASAQPVVLIEGERSFAWVTEDPEAAQLDEGWGRPKRSSIVRISAQLTPLISMVDPASLIPEPATHKLLTISTETDRGQAHLTAQAIAGRILTQARTLAPGIGGLQRVDYSDRYIRDPFTALLLLQTVAALAKQLRHSGQIDGTPTVAVQLRTQPLVDGYGRTRATGWGDWKQDQERADVIQALGRELGLEVTLALSESLPHARSAKLEFAAGPPLNILFDQGFGAWRGPRLSNGFLMQSVAAQVQELLHLKGSVGLQRGASTYFVIGLG